MHIRRLLDLVGILLIGDGVVGVVAPRRHSLLWNMGPKSVRDLMTASAKRPGVIRVLAAVEVAAGLWLSMTQYSEE